MNEYTIHGVSVLDTCVALECEADRAKREGFHGVADRQRAVALHLRNAERHMMAIAPAGHRVQMDVVFRVVPSVNPVLRPEHWVR